MNQKKELTSYRVSILLILIVIVGLYLRLDFLIASNFVIDSDEAIVGLMARHMALGEPAPVFYYGQHYMGSLEPILLSIFFRVFGFVHELIKVVPLLFSLALIVLSYFLGKEVVDKRAGIYAALFTSIAPSTLLVWSSKARGGFIEIVVLAAIAALMAIRWFKERGFDWSRLGILSFLLGFGWWINNQIVYLYIPIFILVLLKSFISSNSVQAGVVTFAKTCVLCPLSALLGGAPFWIYNLQENFASFHQLFRESESDVLLHLTGFFETAFPILLGAKRYWQTAEIFPGALLLFYIILAVLLFTLTKAACQNRCSRGSFFLLAGIGLCSTAIFVMSPYGYLSEAPRYLLPLYMVIFPLLGASVSILGRQFPIGAKCLIFTLLVLQMYGSYGSGRAIPGEPFVFSGDRVAKDHTELIQVLDELKISQVRTNYWIGYRLAYETDEKVTFLMFQEPYQVRIPRYEIGLNEVEKRTTPLLLVPGQAEIVLRGLDLAGYSYQQQELAGYVLIYSLNSPKQERIELHKLVPSQVQSSLDSDRELSLLSDQSLDTRWASHQPQAPGMEIRFVFENTVELDGFQYDLGKWQHDAPRGFEIIGRAGNEESVLFTESDYRSLSYLDLHEEPVLFRRSALVDEVGIRITKGHPVLDWSIAELRWLVSR